MVETKWTPDANSLPSDVVEIRTIESTEIIAFARAIGEKIVVIERDPKSLDFCTKMWGKGQLFLAHFKDCDIIEGIVLCGAFGNGDTPRAAIADYGRRIQGQPLVFRAHGGGDRKEIMAPPKLHLGADRG